MAFLQTSCPIKILELVANYVGTDGIAKLVTCGDRALNTKLGKCEVVDLTIKWSPVRWIAWPSTLLALLPNLRHICMASDVPQQVCPRMDLKTLPWTIESLSLACGDVFLYLKHHSLDLRALFPSLTSLSLRGDRFTPDLLYCLPKQLKSLKIDCWSETLPNSDFFPHLPQELTELSLLMHLVDRNPDTKLPSSLKLLHVVVRTNFDWCSKLPCNLTDLTLSCESLDKKHPQDFSLDRLPRTLESLTLNWPLELQPHQLASLPPSLTSLMAYTNGKGDEKLVAQLPSGLRKLLLWDTVPASAVSEMLMPNLVELYSKIKIADVNDVLQLNPAFRALELGRKPGVQTEGLILPPFLTTLSISWLDEDVCKVLPQTLQTLETGAGRISVEGAAVLPKSLTYLDVNIRAFECDEVFRHLGHIKTMEWRTDEKSKPCMLTPRCLEHLTAGAGGPALENFFISHSEPSHPSVHAILQSEIFGASFSHLSNLRHFCFGDFFTTPCIELSTFRFPASLDYLELNGLLSVPTRQHLKTLPHKLRILDFRWGTEHLDSSWDAKTFKYLPRTLQSLTITYGPRKLTAKDVAKYFPPHLAKYTAFDMESTQAFVPPITKLYGPPTKS